MIRKLLWLAGGMLLLWVFNLGRLILVFWAGKQYGEHFAIDVLHPYIGLVLFVLGIGIMMLCIRPLGLRIGNESRVPGTPTVVRGAGAATKQGQKHSLAVPRVYLAVVLVLVLGIIVGFSNVGLQSYNLVADVSGAPKLDSYIADPVTPVGWTSRYEATFDWAAPAVRRGLRLESLRALLPASAVTCRPGPTSSPTSSTLRISSPLRPSVSSSATSSTATRWPTSQTSVWPGGITGQAMAYTSQQYGSWSIVYWILPVKNGSSTTYERIVLYVQNQHGVVAQATNAQQAGITQADRRPRVRQLEAGRGSPERRFPGGLRPGDDP